MPMVPSPLLMTPIVKNIATTGIHSGFSGTKYNNDTHYSSSSQPLLRFRLLCYWIISIMSIMSIISVISAIFGLGLG
jgi:hypothetical protein